ncbi:MAG TPA: CHASE4 domain-containing protein, partial [Thermotogota bacterium]|nr:CHASE4 domain-containing protein [Thermotogota bacterium]
MIGITMGAAVVFGLFTRFFLLDFFSRLESEEAQRDLLTIRRNLDKEREHLSRTLADWANWDDLYAFALDQNESFLVGNLMDSSWENLGLDQVLICALDGSILFTYGGAETQLPVLMKGLRDRKDYSGFLNLGRMSLVAIRPIRDNTGQSPCRGWIMISRYFGTKEIEKITSLFPTSFSIVPLAETTLEGVGVRQADLFDRPAVRVVDAETIEGYFLFNDLFGNETFILKTETPRLIYNRGIQATRYLVLFALALVVLSLVTFVSVSYKYVLSQLLEIGRTVRKIISTKELSSRIPPLRRDEVGTLGQDINAMLDTIEKDQNILRESEARLKRGERFGRMGYWEYDLANDSVVWTEGLYALYELDPKHPDSPKDIFFRGFLPEEKTLLRAAMESIRTGGLYRYIHRIILPDGATKYIKEEANGIYEGVKLVKVVGTTQDVTESVLNQKALEGSQDQLKIINFELEIMNRELQEANTRADHFSKMLENLLHLTTHISDNAQGNVTDFLNQLLTISLFLVENIQSAGIFVREDERYVLKFSRRPKVSEYVLPTVETALLEPLKMRPLHIEWDKVVKGSAFDQIKLGLGEYVADVKESLFIPLTMKHEVYGALSLEASKQYPGKIQEEDKRIAESLGSIGSSFLTLQNALASQDQFQKELIMSMIQILELYDPYTKGHSEKVAKYAYTIARKMKLSDDSAKQLYWTGLVHDIGKLLIPRETLNKPTKLTKEEFEGVKNHSVWGSKVLSSSERTRDIAKIVLYHHERIDGLGYPEGLKGDQIPLEARIIAVADAYDAMTNDRSYKKKIPIADALRELERCKGTQFDSAIVDIFIRESLYLTSSDGQ